MTWSEHAARWLPSLAGALLALQLAACGAQPGERLAAASSTLREDVCFSVQDLGPTYSNPFDASLGINARGTVVGTRGSSPDQRTRKRRSLRRMIGFRASLSSSCFRLILPRSAI